mgnify:CR=1 FL=1
MTFKETTTRAKEEMLCHLVRQCEPLWEQVGLEVDAVLSSAHAYLTQLRSQLFLRSMLIKWPPLR